MSITPRTGGGKRLVVALAAVALAATLSNAAGADPGDTDTNWGSNGTFTLDVGRGSTINDTCTYPDNTLFGTGFTYLDPPASPGGPPRDAAIFVFSLTGDGTVNRLFGGGDGIEIVNPNLVRNGNDAGLSIECGPDGTLYVSTFVVDGPGSSRGGILALNQSGARNGRFSGDGQRTFPLLQEASDVTAAQDGRLWIAGPTDTGGAIMGLRRNGAFNNNFSEDGLLDGDREWRHILLYGQIFPPTDAPALLAGDETGFEWHNLAGGLLPGSGGTTNPALNHADTIGDFILTDTSWFFIAGSTTHGTTSGSFVEQRDLETGDFMRRIEGDDFTHASDGVLLPDGKLAVGGFGRNGASGIDFSLMPSLDDDLDPADTIFYPAPDAEFASSTDLYSRGVVISGLVTRSGGNEITGSLRAVNLGFSIGPPCQSQLRITDVVTVGRDGVPSTSFELGQDVRALVTLRNDGPDPIEAAVDVYVNQPIAPESVMLAPGESKQVRIHIVPRPGRWTYRVVATVLGRVCTDPPAGNVRRGQVSFSQMPDSGLRELNLEFFSATSAPGRPRALVRSPATKLDRVAKVELAVVKLVGGATAREPAAKRCLWLKNRKAEFKSVAPVNGRCREQLWLPMSKAGRNEWTFRFRERLPFGHYVAFTRAINRAGLAEDSWSKRDRNKVEFRVRRP